jgi:hypothetical protein
MKVLIMKTEPTTENTDAVRMATTRASALPFDNGMPILIAFLTVEVNYDPVGGLRLALGSLSCLLSPCEGSRAPLVSPRHGEA